MLKQLLRWRAARKEAIEVELQRLAGARQRLAGVIEEVPLAVDATSALEQDALQVRDGDRLNVEAEGLVQAS
jgi:hypothetical protein